MTANHVPHHPASSTTTDRRPSPAEQAADPDRALVIHLSVGHGEGPTELSAFDAALRRAGIANFNLLRLSSVIPPGTTLVTHAENPPAPEGGWGDRLYVVMAEQRASVPGEEAWAGIGWVQDDSGKGLFVEHEGPDGDQVEADIRASLESLCAGRPETFGPINMVVHGVTCEDAPVCALAVAVYESQAWEGVGPTHAVPATGLAAAPPAPEPAPDRPAATADIGGFAHFSPHEYLDTYYAHVGPENDALLSFLVEAFDQVPPGATMLEFGSGPTIYQLLAAAERVGFIDVADPVAANLKAIADWRSGEPDAFDWSAFVARTLELGGHEPTLQAISEREEAVRRRIRKVIPCDAFAADPLLGHRRPYDVVSTHFVAESITSDRQRWSAALANVASLVAPGGRLVMSALEGARSWSAGPAQFPAVSLQASDLVGELGRLGLVTTSVSRVDAEDPGDGSGGGYDGLLFVAARKEPSAR